LDVGGCGFGVGLGVESGATGSSSKSLAGVLVAAPRLDAGLGVGSGATGSVSTSMAGILVSAPPSDAHSDAEVDAGSGAKKAVVNDILGQRSLQIVQVTKVRTVITRICLFRLWCTIVGQERIAIEIGSIGAQLRLFFLDA